MAGNTFLEVQISCSFSKFPTKLMKNGRFSGGIMRMRPAQTPYGIPVNKIPLGTTTKTQSEFESWLKTQMPKFTMSTYNLASNNCNHFTNTASTFLLGKGIPSEIVNLPDEFFKTPIGQMMRPMVDSMMGGSSANAIPLPVNGNPTPSVQNTPSSNAVPVTQQPSFSQNTTGGNPFSRLGGLGGLGGLPNMPNMPGMGGMPNMPNMNEMMSNPAFLQLMKFDFRFFFLICQRI